VEALHRQQALEPLFEFAAKNLAAKPGIADALYQKQELSGGTPRSPGPAPFRARRTITDG